jgi:hypothetical protein
MIALYAIIALFVLAYTFQHSLFSSSVTSGGSVSAMYNMVKGGKKLKKLKR